MHITHFSRQRVPWAPAQPPHPLCLWGGDPAPPTGEGLCLDIVR